MTQGGFDKIEQSDTPLYGPRKLLLCGFNPDAQDKFKSLLHMSGISDIPLIWAGLDLCNGLLSEILEQADGSGQGQISELPRAVIAAGITQNELHRLMDGCRQSGMNPPLWAVLTPTSEKWPLIKLLAELEAERMAMARRNKSQP